MRDPSTSLQGRASLRALPLRSSASCPRSLFKAGQCCHLTPASGPYRVHAPNCLCCPRNPSPSRHPEILTVVAPPEVAGPGPWVRRGLQPRNKPPPPGSPPPGGSASGSPAPPPPGGPPPALTEARAARAVASSVQVPRDAKPAPAPAPGPAPPLQRSTSRKRTVSPKYRWLRRGSVRYRPGSPASSARGGSGTAGKYIE